MLAGHLKRYRISVTFFCSFVTALSGHGCSQSTVCVIFIPLFSPFHFRRIV